MRINKEILTEISNNGKSSKEGAMFYKSNESGNLKFFLF